MYFIFLHSSALQISYAVILLGLFYSRLHRILWIWISYPTGFIQNLVYAVPMSSSFYYHYINIFFSLQLMFINNRCNFTFYSQWMTCLYVFGLRGFRIYIMLIMFQSCLSRYLCEQHYVTVFVFVLYLYSCGTNWPRSRAMLCTEVYTPPDDRDTVSGLLLIKILVL